MVMKQKIHLIGLMIILAAHTSAARERIILLNEGNWQADNGKISLFDDGRIVSNEWFREVNGYKLGDTPNDIISVNDRLIAIAINWSNIVQFITPEGRAVAATEDVPNNRKLATDGRYVYVTSYGHECGTVNGMVYFTKGYVAKIDIETFKVVDTVEVGYEPEGIACHDGYLFVANTGGYAFQEDHPYETTVSIIRAEDMEVVRHVDTGQINLYGKMSKSGPYLCINSPGDYYDIDAATIIFDCDAALEGRPDSKCFARLEYASTYNCTAADGSFYAIGSRYSYYTGEYTFNYVTINPERVMATGGSEGVSNKLPGTVREDIQRMTMPYGIYVNPYSGYIYATDAGSFAAAGALHQWTPEGRYTGQHKVYINPAHFLAIDPRLTNVSAVTGGAAYDDADAPYVSLQGIRVERPQSGNVYIRNGRKILYKK